jgi:hypothetical protein
MVFGVAWIFLYPAVFEPRLGASREERKRFSHTEILHWQTGIELFVCAVARDAKRRWQHGISRAFLMSHCIKNEPLSARGRSNNNTQRQRRRRRRWCFGAAREEEDSEPSLKDHDTIDVLFTKSSGSASAQKIQFSSECKRHFCP